LLESPASNRNTSIRDRRQKHLQAEKHWERYRGSAAYEDCNLEIVDRWSDEAMDELGHAGWDLLSIIMGPNSFTKLGGEQC
jgi:hypothetical protein